jgi:hypothetical protein
MDFLQEAAREKLATEKVDAAEIYLDLHEMLTDRPSTEGGALAIPC